MRRHGLLATVFAGAVALWLFASRSARAEPASGAGDLEAALQEAVVTTPTRAGGNAASTAPAVTSTISAEQLEQYGIRSLAEAINFVALGMVTQNARLGDAQVVGARGVLLGGNSQVLVLLNGHVINDQDRAVAALLELGSLPIEIVDHIEVMLGPGSVLYGGNAMLGVVNVVTKRAAQYSGLRLATEWSVVPPVSSRTDGIGLASRHAAGAGTQFELFGAPAELTMHLQLKQIDRPTLQYGPPNRVRELGADTVSPSALARLVVGKWDATLYVNGSRGEESPRDEMPIRNDGPQGAPGAGHRAGRANLDVVYRHRLNADLVTMTRLFGDFTRTDDNVVTYDGAYGCPDGLPRGCVTSTTIQTPKLGAELQATYDWTEDAATSTMVGIVGSVQRLSASIDSTDAYTGVSPRRQLDLDRVEGAWAAYIQQTLRPTRQLSFNLGARYDHESRFGGSLSPRAAGIYVPWKGASIKGIYSEAFRGPTIVESFFHHPTLLIRAGELKPETVRSAELAFEQWFGTHRVSFGVFRTWWADLVRQRYYNDIDGFPQSDRDVVRGARDRGELNAIVITALRYENVGSISNYGMNATLEGTVARSRLEYGLNLTEARAMVGGVPLEAAPRVIGNARLAYHLPGGLPTVSVAGTLAAKRSGDPSDAHLRAALTGPFPGVRALSFRAMVDYAFNEYSTSRAPEPPDGAPERLPIDRVTVMLGLGMQAF